MIVTPVRPWPVQLRISMPRAYGVLAQPLQPVRRCSPGHLRPLQISLVPAERSQDVPHEPLAALLRQVADVVEIPAPRGHEAFLIHHQDARVTGGQVADDRVMPVDGPADVFRSAPQT